MIATDYGTKSGVIRPGDINTAARLVSGWMSTIYPDQIGDVVIPSGYRETDHFKSYKSVNLEHDLLKPIGTHRNHELKPEGVRVTFYCSKSILGNDVFTMITEGVLSGLSLHWDRKTMESRPATEDDRKKYGGSAKRIVTKWPILTYAVTAVAMNAFTTIDDVKSRFHNEVDRMVRLGKIKLESAVAAGLPVKPAVSEKFMVTGGIVWKIPA